MKILYVVRAPVGGLFRHVCDCIAGFSSRGYDVGLVYALGDYPAFWQDKIDGLLPQCSLGVHAIEMSRMPGIGDLISAQKVAALALRLGVDVIHGHGAKGGGYARLSRLFSKRLSKASVIYTPHGGVLHFDPHSVKGKIFFMMERAMMARTDVIVFESQFSQNSFQDKIGVITCPHSIVYNGLSSAEFIDGEKPFDDCLYDCLFIGEFRELKGIWTLLQAIEKLETPQAKNLKWLFVGSGPDEEKIRHRITESGLSDVITVSPPLPAVDAFSQCKMLVFPSHAEALPYVVMEAAAQKMPLIATDVGGVREIVFPARASLIEAGDCDRLKTRIEDMACFCQKSAADPHQNDMLWPVDQVYDFVKEQFHLTRMVDRLEALYLQRDNPSPPPFSPV